ncbi:MAG: hypothetical protein ACLGPL_10760, partial [Acidobacteriota bacterium]
MSLYRKAILRCVSFGLAAIAYCALGAPMASSSVLVPQTPMAGNTIPKFVEPVPTFGPGPGSIPRVKGKYVNVAMREFQQQILPPPLPKTWVWGYKVGIRPPLYPGVTIEAERGTPNTVTYVNRLPYGAKSKVQPLLSVDQTIHWADPL